jgi:hypothetical protein
MSQPQYFLFIFCNIYKSTLKIIHNNINFFFFLKKKILIPPLNNHAINNVPQTFNCDNTSHQLSKSCQGTL